MGDVIAFKTKTPAKPEWLRRLTERWHDPASWRERPDGAQHFTYGRCLVIVHPNTGCEPYEGWWGFIVYAGDGTAEHSEHVWYHPFYAKSDAWDRLVELLGEKVRATR